MQALWDTMGKHCHIFGLMQLILLNSETASLSGHEAALLCPRLCDPMNLSIHGIVYKQEPLTEGKILFLKMWVRMFTLQNIEIKNQFYLSELEFRSIYICSSMKVICCLPKLNTNVLE